ncbi:hypothetical protein [Streptomyces violens]|uniref:hypothetical protein n=1 Tax=Streptomyces violens TaxID=66377 RepID=UPI0004BFE387|nr:hypothetical protein [Streptomyces violens]
MRRFIGRSVAAAMLATAVVLPVSGVAQAAPQAPSVATWQHHDRGDCKCKHKHDRWDDDDHHGWWGHHGLLSSLLHILL